MTSSPGVVRRDVRASALGLTASSRLRGEQQWRAAELLDVSVGGALVRCGVQLEVGKQLELRLSRVRDDVTLELKAEVVRAVGRGEGAAAGLRFVALSPAATTFLTEHLNNTTSELVEIGDLGDLGDTSELVDASNDVADVPLHGGVVRLHDQSLYDLLGLDPSCPDGEIESQCEEYIAEVSRMRAAATGRKEERLTVLFNSLERMRPLWTDPIKRARYDLRWEYLRIDERVVDAQRGAGVPLHILAGIWLDLYPERVFEAAKIVARAQSQDELAAALREAIDLEPFARRWRQKLAAIYGKPEVDDEGAMPAPFQEAPLMRGSLSDLSLRGLLLSLAENEDEAEVEVRAGGEALGVLGVSRGDIVVAIAGKHRGLPALRELTRLKEGGFQVRYAPPREELRHMREPVLEMLRTLVATAPPR